MAKRKSLEPCGEECVAKRTRSRTRYLCPGPGCNYPDTGSGNSPRRSNTSPRRLRTRSLSAAFNSSSSRGETHRPAQGADRPALTSHPAQTGNNRRDSSRRSLSSRPCSDRTISERPTSRTNGGVSASQSTPAGTDVQGSDRGPQGRPSLSTVCSDSLSPVLVQLHGEYFASSMKLLEKIDAFHRDVMTGIAGGGSTVRSPRTDNIHGRILRRVQECDLGGITVAQNCLVRKAIGINSCNNLGQTAMTAAIVAGKPAMVQLLQRIGATTERIPLFNAITTQDKNDVIMQTRVCPVRCPLPEVAHAIFHGNLNIFICLVLNFPCVWRKLAFIPEVMGHKNQTLKGVRRSTFDNVPFFVVLSALERGTASQPDPRGPKTNIISWLSLIYVSYQIGATSFARRIARKPPAQHCVIRGDDVSQLLCDVITLKALDFVLDDLLAWLQTRPALRWAVLHKATHVDLFASNGVAMTPLALATVTSVDSVRKLVAGGLDVVEASKHTFRLDPGRRPRARCHTPYLPLQLDLPLTEVTPLWLAVMRQDSALIRILVDNGANPDTSGAILNRVHCSKRARVALTALALCGTDFQVLREVVGASLDPCRQGNTVLYSTTLVAPVPTLEGYLDLVKHARWRGERDAAALLLASGCRTASRATPGSSRHRRQPQGRQAQGATRPGSQPGTSGVRDRTPPSSPLLTLSPRSLLGCCRVTVRRAVAWAAYSRGCSASARPPAGCTRSTDVHDYSKLPYNMVCAVRTLRLPKLMQDYLLLRP